MARSQITKSQKALIELELRKRQREREANKKPFNLLDLILATHPNYDVAPFHRVICHELEEFVKQVERGESPRLIINVPPQHGKSTIVSEKFPVYALSKHPDWNIIVASYAATLAQKFSRRARDTIKDQFIKNNAPHLSLAHDKQGVEEWETNQRGGYKATGIMGGVTGSPARIIVLDDLIKNQEEAYSPTIREKVWENYISAVETRLAPGGGVIAMATRWHTDDYVGRLIELESEVWKKLIFPAIAEKDEYYNGKLIRKADEILHPARYAREKYERMKKLSSWVWNSLYQQKPVENEGVTLKRHWWKFYEELPTSFDLIIQSWDMAFKDLKTSDYVVGQVWGKKDGNAYLLDQVRAKLDMPNTVKAVISMRSRWPDARTILIEDKANGPAVISTLKNSIPGIIAVEPNGSKEARVAAVSPFVESGNVYLPRYSSFTTVFIDEAASFPKGSNDDQVDTMSQALFRLFVVKSNFGVIDY